MVNDRVNDMVNDMVNVIVNHTTQIDGLFNRFFSPICADCQGPV